MTTEKDRSFHIPNLPDGFVGMWRKRVPEGVRFWEDATTVGDDNYGFIGNSNTRRPGAVNSVVLVRKADLAPKPGWNIVNGHNTLVFYDDRGDPMFMLRLEDTEHVTSRPGTKVIHRQMAMEKLIELLPNVPRVDDT